MLNDDMLPPEKIRNKVSRASDQNLLIDGVDAFFSEDGTPKKEKIIHDLDMAVQVCETYLEAINDDQRGAFVDQLIDKAVKIFD